MDFLLDTGALDAKRLRTAVIYRLNKTHISLNIFGEKSMKVNPK